MAKGVRLCRVTEVCVARGLAAVLERLPEALDRAGEAQRAGQRLETLVVQLSGHRLDREVRADGHDVPHRGQIPGCLSDPGLEMEHPSERARPRRGHRAATPLAS